MNKNTDKAPVSSNVKIEYLGLWGTVRLLLKVFALTAVVVIIAKYIFKVPLTF